MNTKKTFPWIIFSLIIIVSLIYAANQPLITNDVANNYEVKKDLSNIQINACNSADIGGTCTSKLVKLNLVSPSDCCHYLGKCC